MSIHVLLRHRTTYRYDKPISMGAQVIRLRPAPHCRTPIVSYSLHLKPEERFVNWQQDAFSNYLARVVIPEKTKEFEVLVEVVAEMAVYNPFDFFLEPHAEEFPFAYDEGTKHDLASYLKCEVPEGASKKFDAYVKRISTKKRRTIDFLVEVNQMLQSDISYLIRLEPGVQTPEETLTKCSGSCRDSAWLFCNILRRFGLATRFVSGYLIQLKPDVKALDGPSGTEVDFTDLHAWTEVYLPGAGWVGLDPTSGLMAGEGHIPLACSPEPSTAAPISGATEKCEVEFDFEMSIHRVHESPRVTMPYTDEQWAEITALGEEVDRHLKRADVRLTMGGEPTFVSVDDMEGGEWNFDAMGPMKRGLAYDLLRRLQKRFSPGALLHFGQGKWYPGEQLPRWAFGCFWRRDGTPIWENFDLVADERKDYGATDVDSMRFIEALSHRLEVDSRKILPAYEDAWYYLWKERRLPTNVDPHDSELKDEMERARLARIFEQGLDKVVGHVLPIRKDGSGWMSGSWFLRPETLFLAPGDSPVGFRLPIDSLPWVKASEYPWTYQPDPTAQRPELPKRPERRRELFGGAGGLTEEYVRFFSQNPGGRGFNPQGAPGEGYRPRDRRRAEEYQKALRYWPNLDPNVAPGRGQSAPWVVRTALSIEPRNGKLNVFMPPTETLEDYLELVSAIEETADYLKMPVMIEGYPPPGDPRLNVIKVTPDPGVIEVNTHPAHSWKEMVEITEGLYEDAHQSRLATEKFMVDGRHTGTGGGNHIVLGGATPSDSPFLRRPDVLRSLLNYWHNHPSLSYLFSGLFIGPTCQSPRIDEARNDALYELEIAFNQIPDRGYVPPWLVDRVFRNLLVDVSGNVHRSEFCIDKLYSPDGSSGRQGLLEMRAFEMPPHARMSLTQQLLLRTLVSEFWERPYRQPLVPWGTELHDRYLLPHFIEQDFNDVVGDLKEAGYGFKPEWFAPHQEFRFPFIGKTNYREVEIEIRNALEPWHVLGEEGAVAGTVRYVDSTLERVQVKAKGMIGSRYKVLCNGLPIPMTGTGTVGEHVAGVRYRAWGAPQSLHPTIGVHSPLVIDLYDTWNRKTVGGCTCYVAHPGGRNYATFPINSYEAESRRLSRFFQGGHTPGRFDPPPLNVSPEFPMTLDLRRFVKA
ncbi:Transglutaminase-like superfamily protein [Verrucomicrobium sp. GAS474]|uniref:transglutaminase family protein n=1 Tax=Verrucomicrobium sp. GAS474 TaxID=1882831 RepID=UPI000879AFFF|nr:transglutaminase family protein [Verrucomicrobium sp. GAS474]SDU08079.1 Transglutaminase-like superfamily protein [Verrucomicrobium sp. GAS474]